jgi:hypothetical protein
MAIPSWDGQMKQTLSVFLHQKINIVAKKLKLESAEWDDSKVQLIEIKYSYPYVYKLLDAFLSSYCEWYHLTFNEKGNTTNADQKKIDVLKRKKDVATKALRAFLLQKK